MISVDSSEQERRTQLYEEGAHRLAHAWDDDAGLIQYESAYGTFHDTRGSLAYADVLLRAGSSDDVARAERILANVAALQERREDHAHYGNFKWYAEHDEINDLNAVEFELDALNVIVRDHARLLSEQAMSTVREMIELGLDEIDRLDVHPSYTNIALSDYCNSVLGGEVLGLPDYVERGARRLDEWLEFTSRSGAPHEYNSPTYLAVDIARMAVLAERTQDPAIALKARVAEERLWLHVATHYHPGLAMLSGPHSRSYRDGWTGAPGYLSLMLWLLLGDDTIRRKSPFMPKGREEGHTGIALAEFHCPQSILDLLRERAYPYECIETADTANGADITTYLTDACTLGTSSRSYTVGEPPEPWPAFNSMLLQFRRDAAPGFGTMFARYIANDHGPDAAGEFYDEGVHVAAQHRNRAILAYGLRPRLRPAHSYKLSVQMLGTGEHTQVYAGDRRIEAYPAGVEPGEPVVIADGQAYIAVIPLEPSDMGAGAPIELSLRDGALCLDIYNYRGGAKSFWEYRSLAGPFYRGNVRNAVIIEVASRDDFPDVDAFRRHIAAARVSDSVDDAYVREIAYASDGGSIAMRYSLWDMSLLGRAFDGAPFTPPMSRAGAIDGSGAQFVQSRDSIIALNGVTLLAGRTPKWLFADGTRAVFVNPSDEIAPVWLETPATIVECDAFGFGRIEVDDASGAITVEAIGEIAPIRIRRDGDTTLFFNGEDVTASLRVAGDGVREFSGI